jgi:protoporphyrinogen oxidase
MSDTPGNDTRTIVLGGGISGLTAARAIQEQGRAPIVLEACPSAGGMTRSIDVGEFCFDYTGHLLHLSRHASPSRVPYAGLDDRDWQQIHRRSMCLIGDQLVTAPVQYHLGELRPELLKRCSVSYDSRPALPSGREPTFREFLVSGFGQELSDVFLIPQNRKTMAIELDRLSIKAVKRFFPPPDEKLVRQGIAGTVAPSAEYNSQFWYPRVGGIGRLVDGLKRGLHDVHLCDEAAAIDLNARTVRTRGDKVLRWETLFTSVPLPWLCGITNDPQLHSAAKTLSHSSTISFNLGLRSPLPPNLRGVHWVYVPDPAIPFYRVGFYSNLSAGTCPAGCSSMYVEVGVDGSQLDRIDIAGDLQPRVLEHLSRLGWIRLDAVVCVVAHVLRCAYVHHTPQREQAVQQIFERLAQHGIHPIGRYGLWDYISMEDSIESAIAAVKTDRV